MKASGVGRRRCAARTVTTVVIGAGHAGLAMSHRLSERGIDHVVLERGEVANSWRRDRWEVSVWGRNLTDETFRVHTFISNIAGTVDLWGLPRTYGITLTYSH